MARIIFIEPFPELVIGLCGILQRPKLQRIDITFLRRINNFYGYSRNIYVEY